MSVQIDHQVHFPAPGTPTDATRADGHGAGPAGDAGSGVVDVLTVVGDLDIYSAPLLRERLRQVIGEGRRVVVIDISGVPVLDSMGLGVLVGGLKRARVSGGTVRLAGPTPLATKVLGVTGLSKVFHVYPDVAAALATGQDPQS